LSIACPVCQTPTESLKRYTFVELCIFLLILAWTRRVTYVACPPCMRSKLFSSMLVNMVTAHILWLFILLPWYLVQIALSFTDGHSSYIAERLPR
jgi:hypothetical protein